MAEKVKVFGNWGSPSSKRIEIALKLKGIDYEFIEEDLYDKSTLLLQYNPVHKKIPVLVHNGKPLAESQVILEYIDETWDTFPILPNNPYKRAQARFWARFIDDKCFPTLWKACWGCEDQEKVVEEGKEQLKALENELKDKKFFGGETIGFVDLVGDFLAYWLLIIQEEVGLQVLNEEEFPKLFQWSHDFVNHGVVKENLPPRGKLIAYFEGFYESITASK